MTNQPKIIGVTDEVGTCDCCGRTDLKRTIVLDFDGSIRHFGCECASKAMGRKTSKGLMNQALDAQLLADREKQIQKRVQEQTERRAKLLEMSRADFGVPK